MPGASPPLVKTPILEILSIDGVREVDPARLRLRRRTRYEYAYLSSVVHQVVLKVGRNDDPARCRCMQKPDAAVAVVVRQTGVSDVEAFDVRHNGDYITRLQSVIRGTCFAFRNVEEADFRELFFHLTNAGEHLIVISQPRIAVSVLGHEVDPLVKRTPAYRLSHVDDGTSRLIVRDPFGKIVDARAVVTHLPSAVAHIRHILPDVLLAEMWRDRKSTRLNSSHVAISYAVFCLKKKETSVATTNQ